MDGNALDTSSPLTREALYELVWSEPMLRVATRFGVSSSYMARVCTRMNVPRPQRGYWAKLAAGKNVTKHPLPEVQPGDELARSRDGHSVRASMPLPKPPVQTKRAKPLQVMQADKHPLVIGAKEIFEGGRLSYEGGYFKPTKRLLVDLTVTKSGLEKALTFANQFFLTLERKGYRVTFSPHGEHFRREDVDERETPSKGHHYNNLWSPARGTVVYIGTVAIGLTIIELSEEAVVRYINGEYVRETDYVPPKNRYMASHSWTTTKYFPTGRLCLQAYSPYQRAKWKLQWRETSTRDLDKQVKGIVKELERAAIEIARLVEEGERQAEIERQEWEIQRQQWRLEEEKRRAAQTLKESKDDLLRIIERWGEVSRIQQFFAEIERQSAGLAEDERLKLLDRLSHARELIGDTDPFSHFLTWKSPDER